jgi:hypothetical protein
VTDETRELKIGEISSVEKLQTGNYLKGSLYKIYSLNEVSLTITLPDLESGDTKFIEALRIMAPQMQ